MEIRTYKVYKFDELPKDGQQKAIENLYDINVDYNDWFYDEGLLLEADKNGFYFVFKDIEFDLYRQKYNIPLEVNDETKVLDVLLSKPKYKHKKLIKSLHKAGFICFDSSISLYSYSTKLKRLNKIIDELTSDFDELQSDLAYNVFKQIKSNYEYLTSEELIIETIKANDYDFTIQGNID